MARRISFIPVTLALLFFPSVKYTLTFDGAISDYYGFPLPWNSNSFVTSLGKEIYLLPLAIDLIVLAIISVWVLRALARLPDAFFKKIVPALWVWGFLCAAMIGSILWLGPFFQWWYISYPFHISVIAISIGV